MTSRFVSALRTCSLQQLFVTAVLPRIKSHAHIYFRHVRCTDRGEDRSVSGPLAAGVTPRDWQFESVSPERVPPLPVLPSRLTSLPKSFLRVLAETTSVTARDNTRYALARIQSRGQAGDVIPSENRQMLIQQGLRLPWPDDIRISRLSAPQRPGLLPVGPVEMGCTEKDLASRLGL
jgi:hypothetical protein